MRRKWMPFALAAIIAASAAITPVYADDPPSGSLPSSFEGYRPSGSDAAGGVYLMLTEETIQNWTRPRGESPSQTPSSAAVRRGAKRFQNGVEKISTLTEAVEDMTPGSSPYANISPGMEFIDNILTGIGATSEMVKHPGAERIGTAAEVTQGVIQSQPVVDYIAENKHPIIDFMDQMTIDMNWGITELFGGDGDAYIRNIRDNGYESLAGDFNAFDDVQGQNWQDWRIAQLYQRYAELIAAGKEAEAQALLDRLNSMNQDPSSMTPRGVEVKKPNIYLYPETKTEITVTFDLRPAVWGRMDSYRPSGRHVGGCRRQIWLPVLRKPGRSLHFPPGRGLCGEGGAAGADLPPGAGGLWLQRAGNSGLYRILDGLPGARRRLCDVSAAHRRGGCGNAGPLLGPAGQHIPPVVWLCPVRGRRGSRAGNRSHGP